MFLHPLTLFLQEHVFNHVRTVDAIPAIGRRRMRSGEPLLVPFVDDKSKEDSKGSQGTSHALTFFPDEATVILFSI